MTRSIVASLIALALTNRVAMPDAPDAEKLYAQGQAAFDADRFDEAVSAWRRSYELSKEPGLLFNVAQAYRHRGKPGDCAKALDAYKKFVELQPTSAQRSVAEGFMAEMQTCASAEASTTRPPIGPPPVVVRPSTSHDTATNPGRTKRIVGVAVAGGGVAIFATGLYFGIRASSLNDEVAKACSMRCDWGLYRAKDAEGKSAERNQYIFFGLGGAAIAAGGVLYWLGSRERSSSMVSAAPRTNGAEITWSGSW
jgi:tetratricopeptide (TPR) repeat protein